MHKYPAILFLISIYIVIFSSVSQGNWQNIGGDLEHSGYANSPTLPLELRWKFKAGESDISAPVIDNGILFIGSDNNKLYAIDANTGKLKWSYSTFGKVYTPTAKNRMVFAASFDNYIYALDFNGNLKWQYNTGSSISSPPIVYNNKLYGGFDRHIYSIYINNGSLNKKYRTDDIIESTPSVGQGVIYVGSNDNFIYAFDAENMNLKWKYPARSGISSSPSVIKGRVIIGSKDSSVYALDAGNGALKWSKKTNGPVISSPAVFENSVYIGSNDNMLYSINIDNGDMIWKFNANDVVESTPIVTDNMIYIGSMDGTVYALSHNGELMDKYSIESGIRSMALSDDILFAVSVDGYIYALGAPLPETQYSTPKELPDTTLPEIKINPMPLNTTFEELRISGIANDPGGILVVTVNGIKAGTNNWNATVRLSRGNNTIIVVAVDKAGNIRTEHREVTYIPGGEIKKNPGFYFIYSIVIFLITIYIKKKY